jgi:hypothetical protein
MAMFASDKPTKKLEFEGGFVELQYLSKGEKDQISNQLSSMFAGVDEETLKKLDFKDKDNVPTAMIGVVGKVQEVEYYKLSKAIKAWSSEKEITIETVKDLEEELFDKISDEITRMNELSKGETKN